jgi:hypothetical protein
MQPKPPDPVPSELGALIALATHALNTHTNDADLCPVCGSAWQGEPDGVHNTTMRLGDPAGGILTFERATLPFTPAEFARARALRDLVPVPPLVGLTSHYWARPRQQAAIERVADQHQDPHPDTASDSDRQFLAA